MILDRCDLFYLQIEALKTILERERKDAKAQSSRHKLTAATLRQKIAELQVTLAYGPSYQLCQTGQWGRSLNPKALPTADDVDSSYRALR